MTAARRSIATGLAAVGLAGALAACGSGDGGTGAVARGLGPPGAVQEPVALAVLDDGRVAVGERRAGRVLALSPDPGSATPPEVLATVDVDPGAEGQRGLLGLAALGDRLFAAWTRAGDGRLVVGQVVPGPTRLVWEGPASSDLANGGHLVVTADGRLVVGVGDLRRPDLVDDPAAPNGKLLALDPGGPPGQAPTVLSGGWNNPFAFTTTADGVLWVADNAPGQEAERLGRGDGEGARVDLPGRRAPSALVALGRGRLGLCGFLDGDLVEVDVTGRPRVGRTLVRDACRTGAVVLPGATAGAPGAAVAVVVADGAAVRLATVAGPA